MEQSPSWKADVCSAIKKNSTPFMKLEALLPCSQEATAGPCLEPNESSPHPHTLGLYDPS
jgi:hypothetical protein